ncbi:MAG: COX15/CtaA family protein [Planktomarina sp.]|nr:COX15/CtaA family protein [Planktomarina sp.]MDT2058401.1 COX15/CtaA family protein [Planktomarina sp.]MDT2073808.1 COX15/CtaA family protein [Planktomarina sp.]
MSDKRSIFEEVGSNTKIIAAPVGAISRDECSERGWVRIWLWALVVLIVIMITVGGLTRLTDSGLSITEWDPVMGAVPPLSTAAWNAAFAAYRTTAEFTLQNSDMTLAEFKVIFWWEWGHRQLGRFIGLAWLAGFLILFIVGKLPKVRRISLFIIGPFIGLQGFIGWLMVNSGLDGVRIDVASYWLMAHLGAAFALLGYIFWTLQLFGRTESELLQARRVRERKLFGMSTGLMHFVALQVLLGALVAGIDAGRNYTDWPLMAGEFLPPDLFSLTPWWRNFFEDDGLVQFIHRMSAYFLFVFGIVVYLRAKASAHKLTRLAFGKIGLLLVVQMVLGVVTVMNSSPWNLAILHQFTAILLWLSVIHGRFLAGYPITTSVRLQS